MAAADRPYFAPIDGIRALSVMGVLTYHAALPTSALTLTAVGPLVSRLSFCVALFFLVSGFVLYRPMLVADAAGAPLKIRAFWSRRLARIVPAYWFVFGLCFVVPYVRDAYDALRLVDTKDLWRYLGFAQVYTRRTAPLGFGHAWTLCVDFAFYACLPLYARMAAHLRRTRRVRAEVLLLVALAALSVLLRGVTQATGHGYPFNLTLPGNLLWLAGGMLLALLSVHVPQARVFRSARAHPGRWLLSAVFVWAVSTRIGLPRTDLAAYSDFDWTAEHLNAFVIAVLILTPIAAGAGSWTMRLLTVRPLRELSEVSYEFYLWHLPLLLVMVRLGVIRAFPGSPFLALVLTTAAASFVAAAATHYGVARPLMRGWARRRARPHLAQAAIGEPPS